MRILVVDDDEDVRSAVSRALKREGHSIASAEDLASAEALVAEGMDLIVLDLRLQDGFGLELCRSVRASGSRIPILILSALSNVALRVQGLDAGADDFLAKPFAIAELRARVRALGRRGAILRGSRFVHGDVDLDFAARRALRSGAEVAVTAKEWAILETLANADGRVVARWDLLASVWGDADETSAGSLEVLVARIRRKLGASVIRTHRGDGYSLATAEIRVR